MKRRNGFTLIELLAVIVILAIIAVIATPIIVGIIENARKSAAEDSAYGATETIKLYYSKSLLENDGLSFPITVTWADGAVSTITHGSSNTAVSDALKAKFVMSGTQPKSGSIALDANGGITATNLVVNGYSCTYQNKKFSCPNKAS